MTGGASLIVNDLPYVLRFAVVADDGRRSSEWRVWTGSKKPSDDVYVSPMSSAGRFKISLHQDGYCQRGLTDAIRRHVREEDRAALDKWDQGPEVAPGWRYGYGVLFAESELRHIDRPLSSSTIKIQAPPRDASLGVGILIGDASTDPELELGEQGRVEGYLARRSGGVVAVCSFMIPEEPNWIAEGREILRHPESAWYAGPPLSDEDQFAWGFTGEGEELRAAYEIAVDEPLPWTVPGALREFNGQVRPWAEVPVAVPSGVDPCALLLMPIGEAQPQLFLHEHARCEHSELQRTANELVQAHDLVQLDEGWMRLPDGRYFTLIMTRRAVERARLAGYG
jgi:hypothetical protein